MSIPSDFPAILRFKELGDYNWDDLKRLYAAALDAEKPQAQAYIDQREQLNYAIYREAVLRIFPIAHFNLVAKIDGHLVATPSEGYAFTAKWYQFIVNKKEDRMSTDVSDAQACKVTINAPSNRKLTSDIDPSILTTFQGERDFFAQATKIKGPDFAGRVTNAVIDGFYRISEELFKMSSSSQRDSNAYADTLAKDEFNYPKFLIDEETNPFIGSERLFDVEELTAIFNKHKLKKHVQEMAGSLFSLRSSLQEKEWREFQALVSKQLKDILTLELPEDYAAIHIANCQEVYKSICQEVDNIYHHHLVELNKKIQELSQLDPLPIRKEDIQEAALNRLYVEALEQCTETYEKILVLKDEKRPLKVKLELNIHVLTIKKIHDIDEDKVQELTGKRNKQYALLEEHCRELKDALRQNIRKTAELQIEHHLQQIIASTFAHGKYVCRSAVYHAVNSQSGIQNPFISQQTLLGSALQHVGLKLFYTKEIIHKGETPGAVAYYTAKYGQRLFNLIFSGCTKEVEDETIKHLAQGRRKKGWPNLSYLKSEQVRHNAYITFTKEELALLNTQAKINRRIKANHTLLDAEKPSKTLELIQSQGQQAFDFEHEKTLYLSISAKLMGLVYASRLEHKGYFWGEKPCTLLLSKLEAEQLKESALQAAPATRVAAKMFKGLPKLIHPSEERSSDEMESNEAQASHESIQARVISTHISAGKDVHISAGKDVHIKDAHISAGKDVHISVGKDVHISVGKDAKLICQALPSPFHFQPYPTTAISSSPTQLPSDSQQLVSSLRNLYLAQKTISIFKGRADQEWEVQLPLEEIDVRLSIIEREDRVKHSKFFEQRATRSQKIDTLKTDVAIETLFEHPSLVKEKAKRVYIQGDAGIGKSTLCRQIAFCWAKGELWQDLFSYLFWIPLRDLTLRKYPADQSYTPLDLIAKEYNGQLDPRLIQACLVDEACREKTLLILDGYDELSADAQGNTSLADAFQKLKEEFPHVLITSRPGPCSFTRACDLELLGFDQQGIERYIHRFFYQKQAEDKKQKLNSLLQSSPQVFAVARIPIHLTLLCCLFHGDPAVFASHQSITITAIYERIVNWMYQSFLLRRIDQGKSRQTKEQILKEKNLRLNSEVAQMATVFEDMASFAMQENMLYLNRQEIANVFRNSDITFAELIDCGLMHIPEEEGYFIHLNFREFLTASKVANQYLQGDRVACQRFVHSCRDELRYNLVLRMIAGYLSLSVSSNQCSLDVNPLQTFFEDLSTKPYGLAIRSKLTLMAECFEECQNPACIKQYNEFIGLVEAYIHYLTLLGLDSENLLKNRRILNHPKIIVTIGELFSASQTRRNILNVLLNIISMGQELAPQILEFIAGVLKNTNDDFAAKRSAAEALGKVAEQGRELPTEALAALIQALKEGSDNAKESAAIALGKVAEQGKEFAKEALEVLIQLLKEGKDFDKRSAAIALGKVAEQGKGLAKEALEALTQVLKEGSDNAKGSAAIALGKMAEQGRELPEGVLEALIQVLKEGSDNAKGSVAIALGKMVEQGRALPKEGLEALIQALKEGNDIAKRSAAATLGKVAERGKELPKGVLEALIQVLKEGSDNAKGSVAIALSKVVEQERELAKEALEALIQVLKEGSDNAKRSAAIALSKMAERGRELPKGVLEALIQTLKEDDELAKGSAATALGKVAEQGGRLAKEALETLIQALKGGNAIAAIALGKVAERGRELAKEALEALIQMLKEGDKLVKGSVALALGIMAEREGGLPKEALEALIQALKEKEGHYTDKRSAAIALDIVAGQRRELPKEALVALIQALEEGDHNSKRSAARALSKVAEQGGELAKEALEALIQALKEGNDDAKRSAAEALGKMAEQGKELPKEVLAAFIQTLKEGDDDAKGFAAKVLGKMAERRGELYKEVLEFFIQAFKAGDVQAFKLAPLLREVGLSLRVLNKHTEALGCQKQVLKIKQKYLGNNHLDVAISLHDVGLILQDLGQHKKALSHHIEAFKLRRELLGEKHFETAISFNHMGLAYKMIGNYAEALQCYMQSLKILEDTLDGNDLTIARVQSNIGLVLGELNRHKEALPYLQKGLEINKKLLGDKHLDILVSLGNVGVSLQKLSKYDEALKCYSQKLALCKELLGKKHFDVARTSYDIAMILTALNKQEEAKPYYQRALKLKRELTEKGA